MRKVLVILAMVVCSMALLTSCGQDNSPRGVAEAAVKCMAKKDFKGYMELTNATDQQKEGMVQLLEKVGKEGDSKGGLKSYEIVDEQVDEENGKATVTEYNEARTRLAKARSDKAQAACEYLFQSRLLDFYRGSALEL